MLADLILPKGSLPGLQMASLFTVSSVAEKEHWSLPIKTLIPSWLPYPQTSSKPNHVPKAPPPNTIPWGLRASTYEFYP